MCDLHKSPGTVTILKKGRNGGTGRANRMRGTQNVDRV